MPAIRYRFNYALMTLNQHSVIFGNAISNHRVEVALREGKTCYLSFGGFMDIFKASQYQAVKIVNLEGYTSDTDGLLGWLSINPNTHYCRGVYAHGKVFLCLKENQPITFSIDK